MNVRLAMVMILCSMVVDVHVLVRMIAVVRVGSGCDQRGCSNVDAIGTEPLAGGDETSVTSTEVADSDPLPTIRSFPSTQTTPERRGKLRAPVRQLTVALADGHDASRPRSPCYHLRCWRRR